MKITPPLVVCLLLITLSSVAASPRTGYYPDGICTMDINPWGHAGSCTCDKGKVYDERAGLCFTGSEAEEVMVQGAVNSGMMAIGGETTGFSLQTKDEIVYELVLQTADQEKIKTLNGMWIEVEGESIIINSVELQERKALIVHRFAVLE